MEDGGVDSAANRDRKRKERCLDESADGQASKRKERCVGSGRGRDLEGRYVMKEFPGMGVFLGKVVRFDSDFYRVHYEDGDSEDLEFWEIRDILIAERDDTDSSEIGVRKRKLDDLLAAKKRKSHQEPVASSDDGDSSVAVSGLSSDLELDGEDGDSSGSIGESAPQEAAPSPEPSIPLVPLPLPPSSGDLGVPEEAASHLFSVYTFLRSFSHLIFLSPFNLDSFVGCLICTSQNSLLDSIHVSLMRALRRHLQMLSSDGNGLASRCLGRLDWNLLDTVTWPVILVEYLLITGYTKEKHWRAFFNQVLGGEYYSLPLIMKLKVLQILCDNVLDSAELQAELDMRESAETEVDGDGMANCDTESGPKRVHPRYTKTSACKDSATMEGYVESQQKISMNSNTLVQGADATDDPNNDGNSDECRLCGMDGTLLCCDGCPSAYHSRCIGLSKAHVPNGVWFCPECAVSRMDPACLKIGMGLRGAEVFGIDPYERVYLGTCNYLVVLALSVDGEPFSRYYCLSDVPSVLKLLYTSESASVYFQICKGISHYWHLPGEQWLLDSQNRETSSGLINGGIDAKDIYSINRTPVPSSDADMATATSNWTKNGGLCQESGSHEVTEIMDSSNSESRSNPLNMKKDVGSDEVATLMCPNAQTGLVEPYGSKVTIASVPLVMPTDLSELNIQSSGERSTIIDLGRKEDADSGKLNRCANVESPHLGSSFKPNCYINQYIQGDVAASAAANLAILMSENGKAAECIVSSNTGKVTAENVSLQLKAFSGAALQFQWPNAERKLQDVPRERCGWCIGCKVPPSRKMRCMLNSAALNVLKGSARGLGGIRAMKSGDGTLSAIVAYILHMEESLQGLMIGPLSTESYRSKWRKQLELVSSCKSLKYYLLELEENIHLLVFSAGWAKVVDDWSEVSSVQSGTSVSGLPQKRGSYMRRSKKQAANSEDNLSPCPDWWRGSRTAKMIFQKGVIPRSVAKKAGRQGGFKKIIGISYAEEMSKRSQQFAWRAAVEMSRNPSQLALQVRYLDSHIRWSDIGHPEQISQEAKDSDVEIGSAFRNAVICGKKVIGRKPSYALVFVNKKHLPVRLMKNVVETELMEDGKEKMWFYETHVPLYLIKDYENKEGNVPSTMPQKPQLNFSKFQIRQLKACQKWDIFSYLEHKAEKPIKSSCISCQMDVFLRHAVKCNFCRGLCHKDCVIPSKENAKGDLLSIFSCKKCYNRELTALNDSSKKQLQFICQSTSLNGNCNKQLKATSESILLNRNPEKHLKVKLLLKGKNLQEDSNQNSSRNHPQMQQTTSIPNTSKKNKNDVNSKYGLVWRKRKASTDDDGASFRLQNILLRCSVNMDPLKGPICLLCKQPYNSELMYIRCHTCSHWYHADAVELKESQIFDLMGFRCCKCRRKASPVCPYSDPTSISKKMFVRNGNKPENTENNEGSMTPSPLGFNGTFSDPAEKDMVEDEDASLLSLAEIVEPFPESNSMEISTGWVSDIPLYECPQKLPVRRNIKQEQDAASAEVEPFSESNPMEIATGWSTDMPLYHCPQKLPVRRHMKLEQDAASLHVNATHNDAANDETASLPVVEWDFSGDAANKETASLPVAEWDVSDELSNYDETKFDEMEFEPQTYFSFQELLASEGDQDWDICGVDTPTESSYDWSNAVGTCADSEAGYQAIAPYSSLEGSCLVPCCKCQQTDPAPDLLCVRCKLQIHSHCSPWMELPSWDPNEWECGGCRNWR